MLANKLRMKQRIMNGVSVIAYDFVDMNNTVYRYTKAETDNLALMGKIEGVRAQKFNGEITIKGENGFKIKDIPVINIRDKKDTDMRASIVRKIRIKGMTGISGYVMQNYDGSLEVKSIREVMKEASKNNVKNIRINKSKDKLIMRGVGCNLNDFPTINMNLEAFDKAIKGSKG